MSSENTNIAVLGLGHVGCVSAACLARLGHTVTGIDSDERRVRSVMAGRAPFYEPGLDEILRVECGAGRLSATTDASALAGADIVMICVGTPSDSQGSVDCGQLRQAAGEIARLLADRDGEVIVVVRSTTPPGACRTIFMEALDGLRRVRVVSNPEFLREGEAVKDFMEPPLLVCGADNRETARSVACLYRRLPVEPSIVALETSELIKYACNAFHAVKVAFANEIGALAGSLNVSGQEVMDVLCKDTKLNVSTKYLRPGFAFGGSCLSKDLRALNCLASRHHLDLPVLGNVLPSNEAHLRRAIQAVSERPESRVGIVGLAFKEHTDDLRESPVVRLIENSIGEGRELRIFDPHVTARQACAPGRAVFQDAALSLEKLLVGSLEDLIAWAEVIVITRKLAPEMNEIIAASRIPVLDLAAV